MFLYLTVQSLIRSCWDGNPDARPTFAEIYERLSVIRGNSPHPPRKFVWAMTDHEYEDAMQQFQTLDVDADGLISGLQASDYLRSCGLKNNDTAKVWTLADMDKVLQTHSIIAMTLVRRTSI